MADIPVKPKRTGTPWWFWVVLVVALAALAWLAYDLFTDGDVGDAPAELGVTDVAASPALALTQPILWR